MRVQRRLTASALLPPRPSLPCYCALPPQDNVPPFESETAIKIVESSLGAPVSQVRAEHLLSTAGGNGNGAAAGNVAAR